MTRSGRARWLRRSPEWSRPIAAYTLRQLEVFIAVAAQGSFAAAAEELNTSRTALGAMIDALEENLGTRLLNRRRSVGITLTPEGERFLAGALSLTRDAERLAQVTSGGAVQGELVIGATMSLASTIVPELIARLAARHPGLRLRVIVQSVSELIAHLQAGRIELLVSYAASSPLLPLETEDLFPARFEAVAATGLLGMAEVLPVRALLGRPLAILDNPASQEQLFRYLAQVEATGVDVRYRLGTLALCFDVAQLGAAVALVPLSPALRRTMPSGLEARRLSPEPPAMRATVSWPRELTLSAGGEVALAEILALRAERGW